MTPFPQSWRRPALVAGATAASLVALGLAVPAAQSTPATPAATHRAAPATKATKRSPAKVRTVKVPLVSLVERAASGMQPGTVTPYAQASSGTRAFGMVGVTWRKDTGQQGVTVDVRTKTKGVWSSWSNLDVDPDGDGGDATRDGTEPLWVGSADGVAARVQVTSGAAPKDIRIALVDPGTGPAVSAPAPATDGPVPTGSLGGGSAHGLSSAVVLRSASPVVPAATKQTAPAAKPKKPKKVFSASSPEYTAQPAIISRAQWGARPNTRCDSPVYGSRTLGVVFHHTAGSNGYTRAQSPAIVRAIQAYHMNARGWCDIGYNFLVDKYGQIFEGRNGGVLSQVRGAHAGNVPVNTFDMGVSMMANLDKARPSPAMKAATTRLIGWRLGTNYLSARGTYSLGGKVFKRIMGHRDVYRSGIRPATRTDCPGRYGYLWLNSKRGLRASVARYVASYTSAIKTRYLQMGSAVTGPVSVGEYPIAGGRVTQFAHGDMYAKPGLGARWVTGLVRIEYAALGGATGVLGFPAGELTAAGAGASQHFEGGTVYQVGAGAIGLTGPIDASYVGLKGLAGTFGAPTSRVTTAGTVSTATFQHGTISYDSATGVTTPVQGP